MTLKTELREAYGAALKKLGKVNPRVVSIDADVSSSCKSDAFAQMFPNRAFNVGIAELNMVGMAAGMAAMGLIPFVNAFSMFMLLRGGDTIQNIIACDKLNVKLAGAYTGLSNSYEGSCHQTIGDIAQLRAVPNMVILSVCDAIQCEKLVFTAAEYNGPVYLRISRAAAEAVYDAQDNFRIGGSCRLTNGNDITIFATGNIVPLALKAAKILKGENYNAIVVDVYSIKPIDEKAILDCVYETGAAVTVEEHSVIGGLGGAVAELLCKNYPVPLENVGIEDMFGQSGSYKALLKNYGITVENIVHKCKTAIRRKNGMAVRGSFLKSV